VNQRDQTRSPASISRPPGREVSRLRHFIFIGVTFALPFLLLAAVEGGLRLVKPDGGLRLFVRAPRVNGDYLVANGSVGGRWFSGIENPPTPAHEIFAARKPARAFRVFVMGESAAAGFPYPRNAEFSRLLADMLRDVLPGDSVEVINLAIAATNSFAMLDMAEEVAAQRPDAVLIYAGHNEYYGVLGAASRVTGFGGVMAVRLYLKLLHLRTVLALRNGVGWLMSRRKKQAGELEAASLMEILARDRLIPLGSDRYEAGAKQFDTNLEAICRLFRSKDIPVFVGSLASNLRDQPPFAAAANAAPGSADSTFAAGETAFAAGDSARAITLLTRARDLDVVRFRAPGAFNDIIRRVTARTRATYVPVAEAFAAASPGGAPGSNLFLEHVHPTSDGQALIGRTFFDALLRSGVLGKQTDTTRLRPWNQYVSGMTLTPFDQRIAYHATRTLKSRWPFVPISGQVDYRREYTPANLLDTLAFAVSAGERWEVAKIRLAADYERRTQFDSAAAEYAGLARDAPLANDPWLFLARALGRAGRTAEAESALRRAVAIRPTVGALNVLGERAAQRRELPQAISYFEQSLILEPTQPEILYKLTLAYGTSRQIEAARQTALRLSRMAPGYPGVPGLLKALELTH
jgi:tetratricopeptide (TPR) repeat protein